MSNNTLTEDASYPQLALHLVLDDKDIIIYESPTPPFPNGARREHVDLNPGDLALLLQLFLADESEILAGPITIAVGRLMRSLLRLVLDDQGDPALMLGAAGCTTILHFPKGWRREKSPQ